MRVNDRLVSGVDRVSKRRPTKLWCDCECEWTAVGVFDPYCAVHPYVYIVYIYHDYVHMRERLICIVVICIVMEAYTVGHMH